MPVRPPGLAFRAGAGLSAGARRGAAAGPAGRGSEYLEYTSALLRKEQTPILADVEVPAEDLEIGQR